MSRWHRPYVVLTILAISQLLAMPIALSLFIGYGIAAICCLPIGDYTVDFSLATIGLISLIANFAGAILILIKRKIGLYFSAAGLVLWLYVSAIIAAISLILGISFIAVFAMSLELILGWLGIRSLVKGYRFQVDKLLLTFVGLLVVGMVLLNLTSYSASYVIPNLFWAYILFSAAILCFGACASIAIFKIVRHYRN